MSLFKRISVSFILVMIILSTVSAFVYAAPGDNNAASDTVTVSSADADSTGSKAIAAGIAIGLAAAGGAIGMGVAIAKSAEGISRQPEAEGKLRTNLMLGLVFVETAIIYALIIAILIVFVL